MLDVKRQEEGRHHLRYQHLAAEKTVIINQIVRIEYGDDFPFGAPTIKFQLHKQDKYDGCICLFDLERLQFRDIMKEDYHPSLNFAEIGERSLQFLEKTVIQKGKIQESSGCLFACFIGLFQKKDGVEEGFQW